MEKFLKVCQTLSVCVCLLCLSGIGRTFEFKPLGNKGVAKGANYWSGGSVNQARFQLKIGSTSSTDNKAELEIRAATVMKNTNNKMTGVNDIARFSFRPINVGKALYFGISTGTARYEPGSSWRCWQAAGCIIEIWQEGKLVKHWSNVPGNGGRARLTSETKQWRIDADGNDRSKNRDYEVFDNATTICPINQKGEKVDLDEVLKEFEKSEESEVTTEERSVVKPRKSNRDEFSLKSFCGFSFGSHKPDFEEKVFEMRRPFRHYDRVRPEYGARSECLIGIRLESRARFDSSEKRDEAMAGAAAVFEKKYGIEMEDCGGCYHFHNEHLEIWIHADNITVRNLDFEHKEQLLSKALREASKNAAKPTTASDGEDVL